MKRLFRKCVRCGKRNQWFHVSNGWVSGFNSMCVKCRAKWRQNTPKYREQQQQHRKEASHRARMFVMNYLLTHPCVDCDETNICCLTFDHIRGKKRANISKMILNGCAPKTIMQEIEKTEVRCANCHFIRTAQSRGYTRALIQFGS